jgi:hypothetical protein
MVRMHWRYVMSTGATKCVGLQAAGSYRIVLQKIVHTKLLFHPHNMVASTWHPDCILFRDNMEASGDSFPRYLLTRLYAQERQVLERLYHRVMRKVVLDRRHNTALLGQGDCELYENKTSCARSFARATFGFHDELYPHCHFRCDDGSNKRHGFTVQHIVWVFTRHGILPIPKNLEMVHFCHLRNCCNTRHFHWSTAVENRSRDVCRHRGFSCLQLRQRNGEQPILCFCVHLPCCLILKKERQVTPYQSFTNMWHVQQFVASVANPGGPPM